MRTRTDAVIFDFDGTIADSEPAHMRSILGTITPLGWSIDPDELFTRFVGRSDRYCFQTLAAEHGHGLNATGMDELLASKLELFLREAANGGVRAYAGAIELVHAAAARASVAVCSGSRRATIEPVLRRFGVLDCMRAIVPSDEVERPKPDPEAYRTCCARLGVEPGACVAIEDTDHGIASARGAGVRVIAVEHTCSPARLAEADDVVPRIDQITPAMLGV